MFNSLKYRSIGRRCRRRRRLIFEHQCIFNVFHSVCGILSAKFVFFMFAHYFSSADTITHNLYLRISCGRSNEMMMEKCRKRKEENNKKKNRGKRHRTKNVGHYSLSWYSVARAQFRSLHFSGNLKRRESKKYVCRIVFRVLWLRFSLATMIIITCNGIPIMFHSNIIRYLFRFLLSTGVFF